MTSGNASKWNIPACLYQQGRLALVTCSPHCHSEVPSLVWPRSTSSVHGVLCTLRSQLVPLPVHCSTAQASHIPTVRASHSLTPVTFHGGKSSLSQRDGRLFEDRDHIFFFLSYSVSMTNLTVSRKHIIHKYFMNWFTMILRTLGILSFLEFGGLVLSTDTLI